MEMINYATFFNIAVTVVFIFMSCFYLFIIYLCYETISEYNSLALHVEINVLFRLSGL